jgi:uncharacterized iron-regulated membrane protein
VINVQVAPVLSGGMMSVMLVTSTLLWSGYVHAQPSGSSRAQSSESPESAAERTKRQADNPYKWIIMQDDKPRAKGAAKPPPAVERDKKPAVAQPPERAARAAATTAITPAITPTTSSPSPQPVVAAPATTAPASYIRSGIPSRGE